MLAQVYLASNAILIAYNMYVGGFSVKKSAFRNRRTILHNAPGVSLVLLGTVLWNLLGYELFVDSSLEFLSRNWFLASFGAWTVVFLFNTFTGWAMIPLLPNVDPAVKREFVSLVLCQVSFLPVVLGQIDLRLAQPMRNVCYVISLLGLVFSMANLVLYTLDYIEGKSQKVCSGDYLVKQMAKQEKERQKLRKSTLLQDYVTICFTRGADQTRMPANEIMLFIAVSIVVPFPLLAVLANRFEILQEAYPGILRAPAILMLLMLGTVGNMQVFHGTLAVRGKETVRRASVMVAVTVVVEMLVVFAIYSSVLGVDGFQQYLFCVGISEYCPSFSS